ncbi:TldD/PmbA family protein ['Gossypium sp.' phytoplasma]|uniref:TldD/PmbA family protein n=2 Tax=Candidatus Phytoplasma gossypii TaxID=2982629 RepID=A0ABT9D0F5_9MOLU|nr:TldD/PmbA family protein ['Gossypium sp.' phytoplasma]
MKEENYCMLNIEEIQKIFNLSLGEGIDFVEFFFEDTLSNLWKVIDQNVVSSIEHHIYGLGIRLLIDNQEIYLYTNEIIYQHIVDLILKYKNLLKNKTKVFSKNFDFEPNISQKICDDITWQQKIDKMLYCSRVIRQTDTRIIKSLVNLEDKFQKVWIVNSRGISRCDNRYYVNLSLTSVAQSDSNIQEFSRSFGKGSTGFFLNSLNLQEISQQVAKQSVEMLSAQEIKAQMMTVVINNGSGGVIFHEACGHSLEATSVARGLSPFSNKIGKKIASSLVTAVDHGCISGAWGSTKIDDEGNLTQKNLLISNGILKSYLVDIRNGYKLNMPPTGSGRRESYKYPPTSRMNSTYIAAGPHDPEQIIRDTDYGFYAKYLGGGTVDPNTGEFNFMVNIGYLIQNGQLTTPIKGMMLIGKGQDILLKIDRVGKDVQLAQGYCGSISGDIPVDLGQPTIRIKKMFVSGS